MVTGAAATSSLGSRAGRPVELVTTLRTQHTRGRALTADIRRPHQLFGARGFEGIVEQVAQLERALGIADLDPFTPPSR